MKNIIIFPFCLVYFPNFHYVSFDKSRKVAFLCFCEHAEHSYIFLRVERRKVIKRNQTQYFWLTLSFNSPFICNIDKKKKLIHEFTKGRTGYARSFPT